MSVGLIYVLNNLASLVVDHFDAPTYASVSMSCVQLRSALRANGAARVLCRNPFNGWLIWEWARRLHFVKRIGAELHSSVHKAFPLRSWISTTAWHLSHMTLEFRGLTQAHLEIKSMALVTSGLEHGHCGLLPHLDMEDVSGLDHMSDQLRTPEHCFVTAVDALFTAGMPKLVYRHEHDAEIFRLCGLHVGVRRWTRKNQCKKATRQAVAAAEQLLCGITSLEALLVTFLSPIDRDLYDEYARLYAARHSESTSDGHQKYPKKCLQRLRVLRKQATRLVSDLDALVASENGPQIPVSFATHEHRVANRS